MEVDIHSSMLLGAMFAVGLAALQVTTSARPLKVNNIDVGQLQKGHLCHFAKRSGNHKCYDSGQIAALFEIFKIKTLPQSHLLMGCLQLDHFAGNHHPLRRKKY
jgi:hypothetical protein